MFGRMRESLVRIAAAAMLSMQGKQPALAAELTPLEKTELMLASGLGRLRPPTWAPRVASCALVRQSQAAQGKWTKPHQGKSEMMRRVSQMTGDWLES